MNKIRPSRNIEVELTRNIELMWYGKQNGKDYKRYTCIIYIDCGKMDTCTTTKGGGRTVTRIAREEIIEMVEQKVRNYTKIKTWYEDNFKTADLDIKVRFIKFIEEIHTGDKIKFKEGWTITIDKFTSVQTLLE